MVNCPGDVGRQRSNSLTLPDGAVGEGTEPLQVFGHCDRQMRELDTRLCLLNNEQALRVRRQ